MRVEALAKLKRQDELQEAITAAMQQREYATAESLTAECLEIDPENTMAKQTHVRLKQLEIQAAQHALTMKTAIQGGGWKRGHWRELEQKCQALTLEFPQNLPLFLLLQEVQNKIQYRRRFWLTLALVMVIVPALAALNHHRHRVGQNRRIEHLAAQWHAHCLRAEAAKNRADWKEALAALSFETPPEPFAGAFAADPLCTLLQQRDALRQEVLAHHPAQPMEPAPELPTPVTASLDPHAVETAALKTLPPVSEPNEIQTVKQAMTLQRLRVPEGFRSAPGALAEPYTETGWAQEIIHETTGISLIYIPAGSFTMGSPEDEDGHGDDEGPCHQVTLTQGYYLGKYEVTQAQWEKLMGNNPSDFKKAGARAPVEQVSWDDCQAFCLKAGSGLRLPTEAEWEYACRAGTTTPFHYGNSLDASMANFDGNFPYGQAKPGEFRGSTVEIGRFMPNAWGLYDMHGNVWEWCQDWYSDYENKSVKNPAGPETGAIRVLRGGGWNGQARSCRTTYRGGISPDGRHGGSGFRVCCSVPPEP